MDTPKLIVAKIIAESYDVDTDMRIAYLKELQNVPNDRLIEWVILNEQLPNLTYDK